MVFYKKANFMYNSNKFFPYNPLKAGQNTVLRIRIRVPNTDPEGSIEYGSGSATLLRTDYGIDMVPEEVNNTGIVLHRHLPLLEV